MKRINSNDIAKIAGVSRSTVSRVINGYNNVPDETREKVMKVIKENHYYPQLSGQLLSGKQTKTLGFFWIGKGDISSDPLVTQYFMYVIEAAARRGFLVLCFKHDDINNKDTVDTIRRVFFEGRIDAGIFVGVSNNEPLIDELVKLDKIVGVFDYYHEGEDIPNRIAVNLDGTTAEDSIDYLYGLGHRKIAVIDGDMSRASCVHRHESYMRGLRKHNLPMKNKWMIYGGIIESSGYRAALNMLTDCMDDMPTAICANNDSVAFGVCTACRELGIRVPEDISVIGCDGNPRGETSSPPLTTYKFDFKKLFSSLVYRVIDTIEEKENVPQYDFIKGEFTERSSCARFTRKQGVNG